MRRSGACSGRRGRARAVAAVTGAAPFPAAVGVAADQRLTQPATVSRWIHTGRSEPGGYPLGGPKIASRQIASRAASAVGQRPRPRPQEVPGSERRKSLSSPLTRRSRNYARKAIILRTRYLV